MDKEQIKALLNELELDLNNASERVGKLYELANKSEEPKQPEESNQPEEPNQPEFDILVTRASDTAVFVNIVGEVPNQYDIVYYNIEKHPEWEHSYAKYIGISSESQVKIAGLLAEGEWRFKAIAGNYERGEDGFWELQKYKSESSVHAITLKTTGDSQPIENLKAVWDGKNIKVIWSANTEEFVDLQFKRDDKTNWISIIDMIENTSFNPAPVDKDSGKYTIGGADSDADYKVRMSAGSYVTPAISVEEEKDDETTPAPDISAKKITIHEDSKWGTYTPTFKGFLQLDGKYRAYVFDRRNKRMGYFESNDLENWGEFQLAENQTRGTYFQLDNGDMLFYRGKEKNEEGDEIKIFKVSDDFRKLTFYSSYDWRLDGALLWNQLNGTIYSTGRIRGNTRDKDKGGWGGDIPPYPTVDTMPRIKDAFEEYAPDWMDESYIDNVLKDRRGISLHISKDDGKTWSKGKHIAVPENYDTSETAGWTQKDKNGVGDFYSSVFIDEKRMLVKLYKKEKDRVIERGKGDKSYPFQRRFRFTGETIIVPALYENGKVKLLDNESVIPRGFHERPSHKTDNATQPGKMEVGQTSPFNIIEKDGYVYVLYGYRDDIHYENDYDFYAGIYIAKMSKQEFYNKFD